MPEIDKKGETHDFLRKSMVELNGKFTNRFREEVKTLLVKPPEGRGINPKTRNKINSHLDGIYTLSHRSKAELVEIILELYDHVG